MAAQPKENLAETLLQRAHSPSTASTILREKVKQRPLLLRPTSPDPAQTARSKRQHERLKKQRAQRKSNKPKPLSAAQKRALCVHEIPKSQQKYALYAPVHTLWQSYIRSILNISLDSKSTYISPQDAGPFLASADYHGALVEVVHSRCSSRVGMKGIVVKDTKFTFEIVTRGDEVKVLPKEGTLFRVEVPFEEKGEGKESKPLVFEILGGQFEQRATDRAGRKWRMHVDGDL